MKIEGGAAPEISPKKITAQKPGRGLDFDWVTLWRPVEFSYCPPDNDLTRVSGNVAVAFTPLPGTPICQGL